MSPSYWLTRFVLLRLLGFVYLVHFLALFNDVLPLLGAQGLLPIVDYLDRIAEFAGGRGAGFVYRPSLFWLSASDAALRGTLAMGLILSAAVTLGYANALMLLALWTIQLSFVHVGQLWFSFGWEIQLLETTLIAVFLCPLLDGRPFPRTAPPTVVILLFRWLIVRIMWGSALIKLRGDACWRELTCLDTHFETQPVPHPASWYLHHLPAVFGRLGVAFNHVAELIAPFFAFWPRRARLVAGLVMLGFQINLIASGNLSYLNWLTIVPILACFDDGHWGRVLPRRLVEAADNARARARPARTHAITALVFAGVVAVLSVAPIRNLVSERQLMNTSFDRLHLVNTYGAFGSIGRVRNEIVITGTRDAELGLETEWHEYEWKCKPGDPMRRPCLITPYHYRLDWLIWFAAMSDVNRYPFVARLVDKLLHGDENALSLLESNPFPDQAPRFIRADLYRYEFTDPGDPSGAWWKRKKLGPYLSPLSRDDPTLARFLERHGFKPRRPDQSTRQ
ncbi:MAG: lipase maturation factor family protein [Myxococcales bacterium]|nr:lipase maturation factor family protein [Myxococcales bacterium]